MILESAVLQIQPGQTATFEAAFAQAQQDLAAASGYRGHTLQHCLEYDHQHLLLMCRQTLENHTQSFRGAPGHQQWRKLLHHFYDPFSTVLHHAVVPGASFGAVPVAATTHAVSHSF